MEHLSEVMRILEAALRHDPKKAANYAALLADKLESEQQSRQARALRSTLAQATSFTYEASSLGTTLPVDKESNFATVDVWEPRLDSAPDLILHPFVVDRLNDFLTSVRRFDEFAAKGIQSPNRILLSGPPGTGKTSIARYLACELKLPLVIARSDTLVSSLLGQTSRNIREIFDFSSRQPCILFLDELDALAKERSDAREIGELQRVVLALLQNIDAIPDSTVLIAATNHHQLLDTAVWRRFDVTLEIGLPSIKERASIWMNKLGSFAPEKKEAEKLAQYSDGLSGATIEAVARDISRTCVIERSDRATLALCLRRLVRYTRHAYYDGFATPEMEMKTLRSFAPDVFTLRVLSEMFHVSTRQVSNATRGAEDGQLRTDPSGIRAAV